MCGPHAGTKIGRTDDNQISTPPSQPRLSSLRGIPLVGDRSSVDTRLLRETLHPRGEPGSGLHLLQRLKQVLDPINLFSPARFGGGL